METESLSVQENKISTFYGTMSFIIMFTEDLGVDGRTTLRWILGK
jgi:hypothetical protein